MALWGNHWRRAAARFLGVGRSTFRRWGHQDPPEWAIERLEFERARRREILRTRLKDRYTGVEIESLGTHDEEVPDLEALLLRGGLAPDGYEIHELIGAELFPPRATGKGGSDA